MIIDVSADGGDMAGGGGAGAAGAGRQIHGDQTIRPDGKRAPGGFRDDVTT